jgi:hypothetical protein
MTRRIVLLFVAVVAGDYAALMLISGHLIHFGVAATLCAGSSVAGGLIAYAGRRRRKALALGRGAVRESRDRPMAAVADQQCSLCGRVRQRPSDSPRFVDRQRTMSCVACAPTFGPEPRPWASGRSGLHP